MRLIDADALIDKWRKSLNITEEDTGAVFVGYGQIPAMINAMPTIEERKKGKWKDYPIAEGVFQCTVCGVLRIGEQSNFCPDCGADMRGGDDEETQPG